MDEHAFDAEGVYEQNDTINPSELAANLDQEGDVRQVDGSVMTEVFHEEMKHLFALCDKNEDQSIEVAVLLVQELVNVKLELCILIRNSFDLRRHWKG